MLPRRPNVPIKTRRTKSIFLLSFYVAFWILIRMSKLKVKKLEKTSPLKFVVARSVVAIDL